jgi:hypothetical protein
MKDFNDSVRNRTDGCLFVVPGVIVAEKRGCRWFVINGEWYFDIVDWNHICVRGDVVKADYVFLTLSDYSRCGVEFDVCGYQRCLETASRVARMCCDFS